MQNTIAMCLQFYQHTQACRQVFFLRAGATQRWDGPNMRQGREPLGESAPQEILKIRLSENAFCAFWRQYDAKIGGQK